MPLPWSIYLNSITKYHISKENNPWNKELTLFKLPIEFLCHKCGQDLLQMLNMVLLSLVVHKDIIKVYHYKQSSVGLELLIHQPHQDAASIRQPKWHDKPFVKLLVYFEGSLPLISLSHCGLVITPP